MENYRLLAGLSTHGARLLDHALNYSLSIPLKTRGITKIVIDEQHDRVLRNYFSMGQSLRERLLQEGIEILLLDDILAFLDKKYPQFSATIKLFEQLNRRIGTDDPLWAEAMMADFYHDLIFYFLPDYAFTTSRNPHLTEVTVSDNFFLSSLFLPATSHRVASPLRLILEAMSKLPDGQFPSIVVDGDTLPHLTVPNVGSSGLFVSTDDNSELRFILFPRHYLSVQSSRFARSLAQGIHRIVVGFMTGPNLMRITVEQYNHNQNNPDFFSQNRKTLNELINDNSAAGSMLCFQLRSPYGEAGGRFVCWKNDLRSFYLDLAFHLMVSVNLSFVLPVLKDIADQCKVDFIGPSVVGQKGLPPNTSSYASSDFSLWLSQPAVGLFSNSSAAIDCFRQQFLLNPSDQLKLKYHTKIRAWLDDQPPKCDPALNSNDIIRIITSTDQPQALVTIGTEIISSYPSRAYNFCLMDDNSTRVVNTQPPLSSQASNEGYTTTTNSAFTMGMISGMITGAADQSGHGYLMNHPITRGVVGYCCAGVAGLGLSICGWAMHSYLPHRLRDGAERGSLRHNCAMLVENLSMVLPVLTGGVYQYATSVAGFLLGKCGIQVALGKVWPDQPVVTPQQPASSSKRQKRPSRPAEPVATPNENSNAGIAWDDSVVLRNQMLCKLLDSVDPLPWTVPGIDGMVIAHAQGMADRQERADYLKKQLRQCELATGGVLSAVSRFPELYGEYLHTHQGNDVERAKALWTVLSPGSPQKLLLLVGKMVIQDSLDENKPLDALATLNDPKLTGEACMNIINDLGGSDILFINDVPEKLARAYLAQVNRKERKQKNPEHILKAATQWLDHFHKKPGLTDNLIHLTTDLWLIGHDSDRASTIFHDFRRTLKRQAEVEVRYLRDGRHKVQRYLRAKAIEIALQESNYQCR